MSVGDVVADYVLAAGDPAEVLALTLLALEARGGAPEVRALGPWQWDGSAYAIRNRLGLDGCDEVAVFLEIARRMWFVRFRGRSAEAGGYASPETAAAAADVLSRNRGWLLAPGGLPPRPSEP